MPIYTVEGNIGSGKSTLLSKLKNDDKNIIIIQEPVDDWMKLKNKNNESLFKCFYENPEKYSFLFQIHIMNTRFEKILNYNKDQTIICERSIMTDINIFVEALKELQQMNEFEYIVIKNLYETLLKLSQFKADGIIYLQVDPLICFDRIKSRNREAEDSISLEYLQILHNKHQDWLLNSDNTLIINDNNNLNSIYEFINYNT